MRYGYAEDELHEPHPEHQAPTKQLQEAEEAPAQRYSHLEWQRFRRRPTIPPALDPAIDRQSNAAKAAVARPEQRARAETGNDCAI